MERKLSRKELERLQMTSSRDSSPSTPPVLDAQERTEALRKSTAARQRRAQIKEQLRTGRLSIEQLLEIALSEEALSRMRVREMLESTPGIGKIRALALMEKLNISPTRKVGGLGKFQRAALIKEFKIPSTIKPGRLIVLSGPGGVGKSTVARILRDRPEFWVSISATTRKPRFNEVDGEDYFFYSDQEFDEAISNNEFLEWAEFAGNRYGTPRSAVTNHLDEGHNVLLEIEIAGARQVKEVMPSAELVFLEPPSWEELVSRLEGRGTDSPDRRAHRLEIAQQELAQASFFDTVIVNLQVEEVVERLVSLASQS